MPLKNKNAKQSQMSIKQQLTAQKFSGPLPHPDVLKLYESIETGFADRIISMAESEMIHRHELEKKALDADIAINNKILSHNANEVATGQWLAFFIGCIAILAGAYTAVQNHPVSGSLIGVGGVSGLVTTFILGRKGTEKNSKQLPEDQPSSQESEKKASS